MQNFILKNTSLVTFLIFFCLSTVFVHAQTGEGLFSDPNPPFSPAPPSAQKTNEETDSAKTIFLPFFENFTSRTVHPDTGLWFKRETVYIARSGSVNPPDYGTALFDGRTEKNFGYSTGLVRTGYADSLVSHYIYLADKTPADSLYLSFFYQAQGLGDAPEALDSLTLLAYAKIIIPSKDTTGTVPDSFRYEYRNIWAKEGDSLQPFKLAMIAIKDSVFFHEKFHLKFINTATLNGMYDLWFLDYIYLNEKRSASDTLFNDVAVQKINRSFYSGYTAMPKEHFEGQNRMSPFEITVNNLKTNSTFNVPLVTSLFDIKTNTLLAQQEKNITFSAPVADTAAFDSFQEIALSRPTFIRNTAAITPPAFDTTQSNNDYYVDFSVENYFAYDDGEAEGGYGIRDTRGFGQEYNIAQPDSLIGVQICFVPRYETFPGDRFVLAVWDKANFVPSAPIYQKSYFLSWGLKPNDFATYLLKDTVVALPPNFVVGLIQTNSDLIGVGFDRDYSNNANIYWDSLGKFQESKLNGTLMIRPMVKSGLSLEPRSDNVALTAKMEIFPNPASSVIYVKLPESEKVQTATAKLFDLSGRLVYEQRFENSTSPLALQPPLPSGVFLLQADWQTFTGEKLRQNSKIVWQAP